MLLTHTGGAKFAPPPNELQGNGIRVIPNIRWGDSRTYELCCTGIPHGGTIAIGSHGCIRLVQEREPFKNGLDYVIKHLHPNTIVVYGKAPDFVFDESKPYTSAGRKTPFRLLRP